MCKLENVQICLKIYVNCAIILHVVIIFNLVHVIFTCTYQNFGGRKVKKIRHCLWCGAYAGQVCVGKESEEDFKTELIVSLITLGTYKVAKALRYKQPKRYKCERCGYVSTIK